MKRVLIFSHIYLPYIGGAEVAIKEITDRISDYEFVMVTGWRNKEHKRIEKLGNITVYRVGFGFFQLDQYIYPLFGLLKALQLHKQQAFAATWAMMPSQAGMAALFFKWLKPRVPYMLTDQSGDSDAFWRWRTLLWRPVFKQIFTKANRVQVISNFLADRARGFGYQGKIDLVPNGIEINKFTKQFSLEQKDALRKKLSIKSEQKIVFTTSRLMYKNGLDILIRAATLLPDEAVVLIAGWGDLEQSLKELARNLDLDEKVRFLGSIPNEEVPLYLSITDVFTRPSRSEGQGISFLEAMAARVPVVAPAIGGIVDFLENEKTGLVCKNDDPDDLARQIRRFFEDMSLQEQIINNAERMIRSDYDWENLAKKMYTVFEKLLNSSERK